MNYDGFQAWLLLDGGSCPSWGQQKELMLKGSVGSILYIPILITLCIISVGCADANIHVEQYHDP